MIYLYSHDNLRRWNRGELKVQISVPDQTKPLGWCDGTDEDEDELRGIAEAEDVESLPIQKRILKTGRELWTVGHPPEPWVDEF